MQNKINFYNEQIVSHTQLLAIAQRKLTLFTFLRLLSFLLIVLSCYFIGFERILIPVLIVEISLFIYLINKWLDFKTNKEKEQLYIQLNQQEIQLLNGDWSSFEAGHEFKNSLHPYANDMDLYGTKSIYQYINRTVLPLGAKRLADTLGEGAKNKRLNQEMIYELSQQIEWCQRFVVESKVYLKDEQRQQSLDALIELNDKSAGNLFLRWILPILSISSIVMYNLDYILFSHLLLIFFIVLAVIGTNLKLTNRLMFTLSNRSEKINALLHQLDEFKKVQIHSEEGKKYKDYLYESNGAYQGIKELNKIKKLAEYRMNTIVGVLLNYLLAWDFHLLANYYKWNKQYSDKISILEESLAEVEVWISGAIYAYNGTLICYNQIPDSKVFTIDNLSHPFIQQNKQIPNDFNLNIEESFLIITGPNMAGKSTYLRSVGWAIISANAGFPILASSCSMPVMNLYSSMRTSDDLTVESSYFHAELTRLRFIMDAIEAKKDVFVILDEILKGTNSKDKEIGSAEFLKKLQLVGAKGIIATHDLSLTNLADNNKSFRNVYFDSLIENDELYFDYKVRDGVCKNMNASFLLKKMKLID
ncbi:MAG: hypothetical protein M9916_07995 [Crocinitomicaceae bacterium]|nr:hypothetical protein [Crocinitomicaceae bacterium]